VVESKCGLTDRRHSLMFVTASNVSGAKLDPPSVLEASISLGKI
jgi:hypothetical protein